MRDTKPSGIRPKYSIPGSMTGETTGSATSNIIGGRRMRRSAGTARVIALLAAAFIALGGLAQKVRAEVVDITLLLVCDIYKMDGVNDRGGFARLTTAVKREKARGGHLLYLHAGDTISPSLMSGFDKGAHIIDLTNMEPPDVFVPGNHEFDFGADIFRERMAALNSTLLAANLRDENGAMLAGFADSKMFEFGGVKIGVIGLTAEDSAVKSSPGNLRITGAVETAAKQSAALRAAGADIVVGLTHSSWPVDQALIASRSLDVVLSGDDHDLHVFFDGKVAFAEAKEEAEYLTAVDLSVDVSEKDGKRRVRWWPGFRIIDTTDVPPDASVQAKIDELKGALDKELDVVLGKTTTQLDSRKASVRTTETAIGNLIADAVREAVDADIGLANGGGIRGNKIYEAGSELTRKDVLIELPFGNKTIKLEVTGADIWAILENGFSRVEDVQGRFPHVSGITVEADFTRPAGTRILSIKRNGVELDKSATYTLATNDYVGGGGDGYTMLKGAKRIFSITDAKLIANDVMAYIRARGTIAPKVEGRIVAKR